MSDTDPDRGAHNAGMSEAEYARQRLQPPTARFPPPPGERQRDQALAERIADERAGDVARHCAAQQRTEGEKYLDILNRKLDEPRSRPADPSWMEPSPVAPGSIYRAERERRARFWIIFAGAVAGGLVGFVVALVRAS